METVPWFYIRDVFATGHRWILISLIIFAAAGQAKPSCHVALDKWTDVSLGDLFIDPHFVYWRGDVVLKRHLPSKQKLDRLLLALAVHPNEVIAKDVLITKVWPDEKQRPVNALEQLSQIIQGLRESFARRDSGFNCVQSQRDKGIVWVSDVRAPAALLLPNRERRVADALWAAAPDAVTYEELFKLVERTTINGAEPTEAQIQNSLRQFIQVIRGRLKATGGGKVRNVFKIGYVFEPRMVIPR